MSSAWPATSPQDVIISTHFFTSSLEKRARDQVLLLHHRIHRHLGQVSPRFHAESRVKEDFAASGVSDSNGSPALKFPRATSERIESLSQPGKRQPSGSQQSNKNPRSNYGRLVRFSCSLHSLPAATHTETIPACRIGPLYPLNTQHFEPFPRSSSTSARREQWFR